ncbi:UPF0758 domain-containing protein [Candidatus Odyssella thessalonicensis]|uniref:UPF0758 domain-containing protein n=1 Tax=Candidatus Odyssella thessalonicensis TaxID=84647 RepID=UPI000225B76C|nr:JAB domain-containing protein [Candidatus Odyssella thessalonicensis]
MIHNLYHLPTPPQENHRTRLKDKLRQGPADILTDFELVELMLYQVHNGFDVRPLAKALLERFGGLNHLLKASPEELGEVPGISRSLIFYLEITQALFERLMKNNRKKGHPQTLNSSKVIYHYLQTNKHFSTPNRLHVLYLYSDQTLAFHDYENLSDQGDYTITANELIKRGLIKTTTRIILVTHITSVFNFPAASQLEFTKTVKEIGAAFSIKIDDHILWDQKGMHSLKELAFYFD